MYAFLLKHETMQGFQMTSKWLQIILQMAN